jgi:hypothetical protein
MIINKHTGTTRESPSADSQKCNIALQMRLSLFATALSLTLAMDVRGVQQQQQQQWPSTESAKHKRRSSATHICFWRFLCVCDEQTITRE